MTTRNNYRRQQMRKHRQAQERATRLVLGTATLVAIVVLFIIAASAVGTMVHTGVKMFAISDNVSYYEQQRAFALDTHRGEYATECDDIIRELYAERNALINSDNDIVAFTAMHKWLAIGCIFAFIGLLALVVKVGRRYTDEVFNVFTKVIDVEEFIVRLAVAIVSCILMVVFGAIGLTSTEIGKGFRVIWNQSRPRRKPQGRPQQFQCGKCAKTDNVIEFKRHA